MHVTVIESIIVALAGESINFAVHSAEIGLVQSDVKAIKLNLCFDIVGNRYHGANFENFDVLTFH
jgi:hypothetical protein